MKPIRPPLDLLRTTLLPLLIASAVPVVLLAVRVVYTQHLAYRFLRWNSWEIFVNPLRLASDVAAAMTTPASLLKLLAVVLLFAAVTVVGLLMVPARQVTE